MSACSICQRADRPTIDEALRSGQPGRNALARQFGLAPPTLTRHKKHLPQHAEEPPMEPVPYPQEPEILTAPVGDLQAALARLEDALSQERQAREQQVEALQRQGKAGKTELGEVRQIVAAIPLDPTTLPTRLAKLEARVVSEGQRTQALEADLHQVRRALDGMVTTVQRVTEFFVQLATDEQLWAACLNVARSGSQGTHSSALKEWLARVAGRQLSDNDRILQ